MMVIVIVVRCCCRSSSWKWLSHGRPTPRIAMTTIVVVRWSGDGPSRRGRAWLRWRGTIGIRCRGGVVVVARVFFGHTARSMLR